MTARIHSIQLTGDLEDAVVEVGGGLEAVEVDEDLNTTTDLAVDGGLVVVGRVDTNHQGVAGEAVRPGVEVADKASEETMKESRDFRSGRGI